VLSEFENAWIEQFGQVDGVIPHNDASGALPPGYDAYTCVLNPLDLSDNDEVVLSRWVPLPTADPWKVVDERVRLAPPFLEGWEGATHPRVAETLIGVLDVKLTETFVVSYFPGVILSGPSAFTVAGGNLQARLVGAEPGGPLLFWPRDKRWVACAPYDQWWTYIASDQTTADVLMRHPDLEALACEYRVGS
jgi:hypothetical protein